MNRLRALVLLFGLLGGCKDSEPEPEPQPRPLDEALPPGQVRAGRILRESERIGGPTAKGRIGDFKLYNDRVAVTIAEQNHGPGFQTQGGIILDADWLGENANVSAFGEVAVTFDFAAAKATVVELISNGREGPAIVRATGEAEALPLFEAILGDLVTGAEVRLEWTVDYILLPDTNRLRIEHRVKNLGMVEVSLAPIVGLFFGTGAIPFMPGRGFTPSNSGASGIYYGAASDAVSYLYGIPDGQLSILFGESGLAFGTLGPPLDLRARETKLIEHWLLIGSGDLAATESDWRALRGDARGTKLRGTVVSGGQGVGGAALHVTPANRAEGYVTRSHADASGRFALDLPSGDYRLTAVSKSGVVASPHLVELREEPLNVELPMPASGFLTVRASDSNDRPLPIKLSVTATPSALPRLPVYFGDRPHSPGMARTEYIFGAGQLELPAGSYELVASRGAEYEIQRSLVEIASGAQNALEVSLLRSVDTSGWMSAEPHVHAQWSPDSRDSNEAKALGMAGENIELPVSTDHEAVGDFNPAIASLGLRDWMNGVVGTEISTIRYGHYNAFPLTRNLDAPGFGRIDWFGKTPAEVFESVRAHPDAPYLQVNHPRFDSIGYFRLLNFEPETLQASGGFSLDFDGLEVISDCNNGALDADTVQDWFGLLAAGRRVAATGSTDDHAIGQGLMGYPVTYLRTDASAPAEVSPNMVRAAFREGRLSVSCGPFIDIGIADAQIGDLVSDAGEQIQLRVVVRAASWVDVDELLVLVGGNVQVRLPVLPSVDAERLSTTVSVSLPSGEARDTWIAVWVQGDTAHGPWAGGRRSFAFTNPIFLDRDGDGVWRP